MTRKKKTYLFLTIAWMCFIFGQSLMPAEVSYEESAILIEPMQELSPDLSYKFFRKSAHFVIFGIWGFLLHGLFRQYDRFHLTKPIGAALCGGFIDETIQLFIPGRYSEVFDIWVDLIGAACGILLAHLLVPIIARRWRKSWRTSNQSEEF